MRVNNRYLRRSQIASSFDEEELVVDGGRSDGHDTDTSLLIALCTSDLEERVAPPQNARQFAAPSTWHNSTGLRTSRNINNVSSSSPSSPVKAQFNQRIQAEYPTRYVITHGMIVFVMSALIIGGEMSSKQHFTTADMFVLSYESLDGLVLLGSAVNACYAIAALVSTQFKNYFLIQLLAILNLTACFTSIFYVTPACIVVFVLTLVAGDSSTLNWSTQFIVTRSLMIMAGICSGILNATFFVLIQFTFLKNLNKPLSV